MREGSLIKQVVYTDRGEQICRYGIVTKFISKITLEAEVFWFAAEVPPYHKKIIGIEVVQLKLIEILSEG